MAQRDPRIDPQPGDVVTSRDTGTALCVWKRADCHVYYYTVNLYGGLPVPNHSTILDWAGHSAGDLVDFASGIRVSE